MTLQQPGLPSRPPADGGHPAAPGLKNPVTAAATSDKQLTDVPIIAPVERGGENIPSAAVATATVAAPAPLPTLADGAPALWRAALDAFPAGVAVLDATGTIIAVNDPWLAFARENCASPDSMGKLSIGANYLDVCRRAAGRHAEGARASLAGLQRVLDGREPIFELEYPCPSPYQQRWFLLRAAPLRRSGGGAVVAHFDVTTRHLAEQTLRQELLSSTELIKAMPAGLFIFERRPPDHLVLVDANPEAEWLTGATLERWLGEEFDALWPQARSKGITQALFDVMEGGEVYEAEDHYYSDERLNRSFRLRAFRIGRQRLGLAVEDVTEQRRAEQALRDSEERFRTLVQNVPGVVYLCRNDERYTTLYLSDNVLELTGQPAEVFLKQKVSFVDLYHPEDAAAIRPIVDAAIAQRRAFFLTYRLRHAEGSWRWVEEHGQGVFDADGQLRFLEGTMMDVTERKEAEFALRRTTTMLNNLLASSSEYAIAATDAAMRITHFNPAAERLFQVPAADVLGKSMQEIHTRYRVPEEAFQEALRTIDANGMWEGVLRVRRADGQVRHIRPVVTPMLDESGQRVGW